MFFFNDTATTEIYTLSLQHALPIYGRLHRRGGAGRLDGDFRRQPGHGGHGGQFAPADAAGRRLRYVEQYAAVAAGYFAHPDQCATASHPGGGTLSAGGALPYRAGGIVLDRKSPRLN